MKSRRAHQPLLLHPLPAGPYSSTCCPPALSPAPVVGRNCQTSVAARKSITALSHFSMECSIETCTWQHLPALHPVAFHTSFQSIFCWSFHRLKWQKRCSCVWAVLPPPLHHQYWSSAHCRNCCRYVTTVMCLDYSR